MKMTTHRKPTARPACGRADIYAGREACGTVEPVQGGFLARCIKGRALGTYPTSKEAMRAVLKVAAERA